MQGTIDFDLTLYKTSNYQAYLGLSKVTVTSIERKDKTSLLLIEYEYSDKTIACTKFVNTQEDIPFLCNLDGSLVTQPLQFIHLQKQATEVHLNIFRNSLGQIISKAYPSKLQAIRGLDSFHEFLKYTTVTLDD